MCYDFFKNLPRKSGKKLSGFWLSDWITHQPLVKMLMMFNKIQKLLADEHQTSINKQVSLEDTVDGISMYMRKMTAGKVLVKPGMK